jgi:hypothetical protein
MSSTKRREISPMEGWAGITYHELLNSSMAWVLESFLNQHGKKEVIYFLMQLWGLGM